MAKRYGYLNPDDLTPVEQLDRIIEILARVSFRLAVEQEPGNEEKSITGGKKETGIVSSQSLPAGGGAIPFGLMARGPEREINEAELRWSRRIQELTKELSTEMVARRLNRKDMETRQAGKWSRAIVWRILRRAKPPLQNNLVTRWVGFLC